MHEIVPFICRNQLGVNIHNSSGSIIATYTETVTDLDKLQEAFNSIDEHIELFHTKPSVTEGEIKQMLKNVIKDLEVISVDRTN